MTVIQAVMTIFKTMGLGCVHYLKHFLPPLINVMEVCGSLPGLRELIFQQVPPTPASCLSPSPVSNPNPIPDPNPNPYPYPNPNPNKPQPCDLHGFE